MRRLHLVPECVETSGVFQIARRLAAEDGAPLAVCGAAQDVEGRPLPSLAAFDEVWVHGLWLPRLWAACHRVCAARRRAGCAGPRLVRVPHGSLSPIYLTRQSPWKKRLVAPIERHYFRAAAYAVVTGAHEAAWCRAWGVACPCVMTDLKRFFDLPPVAPARPVHQPLRVLYLGRRHPLKGVDTLEAAVRGLPVTLRVATACTGDAKAAALAWCDVVCLPTLSENFGVVVAEALSAGRRVLTTDGAPAWRGQAGVTYLEGYCAAAPAARVARVAQALAAYCSVPR